MTPPEPPDASADGPLGVRPPHTLAMHAVIDTAIAFLATVILGLILGVPFAAILGIAVLAGVCLAPFTRRTEIRQLAERAERDARAGFDTPPAGDDDA